MDRVTWGASGTVSCREQTVREGLGARGGGGQHRCHTRGAGEECRSPGPGWSTRVHREAAGVSVPLRSQATPNTQEVLCVTQLIT